MSKIFEIEKLKNKEAKLEKIGEYLENLKDALAGVMAEFDEAGDEEAADSITEALDALEDASEILGEITG